MLETKGQTRLTSAAESTWLAAGSLVNGDRAVERFAQVLDDYECLF